MLGNHYDKNHKNHSTVAITNSTIRCQMIFTNACLFSDKNQRTQLLRWAITRTQVRPPRQSPIGQLCLRDGLPLSSARFSRQQIMQQGAFSGRCKSACLMFTHGCLWPVNKHKAPIKVVPSMQESQERLSDSVIEQSFWSLNS